MRLEEISISNFKGLREATFEPTRFSCLIGENNAGKSTVLQAIVYALNRPPQLPRSVFYSEEDPVVFKLTFSGVTATHLQRLAEEHRTKIEPLVVDSALTLVVRYQLGEKIEVKMLRRVPTDVRYQDASIDDLLKGKKVNAVRTAVADFFPEFAENLPADLNITAAKAYLRSKIANLPLTAFEFSEGPLPSGISSSIAALLPEPIYIPAVKNLSDDIKTSQSTSFGRLLGLLLEDMTPDLATVNASLRMLDALLNRVVEEGIEVDNRHEKVKGLESLVEKLLSENFPKVRVELRIPPPELRAILNTAQIFVDDGSKDLIENKGDGIKRSLTFTLLRAYVHHLSEKAKAADPSCAAERPLLFLFEEPELYLHPRSQRVLFDTLARIASTHQVVVTTHSPLFFAPGVTAGFVRVAKRDAVPKPIGELHPVNFDLDTTKAEVFRLARFENADAGFFSGRVVLFEGESDDSFFRHVSKLLNDEWDFEQKNISLVRVSGKGNIATFRQFFGAFGIDVKVVADLDALFDGFQHLGGSDAANALRAAAIQTIDQRITATGIAAEPSRRQIKNKVNQESWRARYEAAKQALRALHPSSIVNTETLQLLDQLFTWENDIARVRACQEDIESAVALVPVVDALRAEGICVLWKGAIE
ncbi:MAG: ATP-dependent endonuclease, partial [Chitinivibrionia bacterium]|nr:ATP-dependent endonuclease [Chitinivibrionia bacterium]